MPYFPLRSNQKISTSAEIHLQTILFLICETPTENEVETIRFGDKFSIRNLIDVKEIKTFGISLVEFSIAFTVSRGERNCCSATWLR